MYFNIILQVQIDFDLLHGAKSNFLFSKWAIVQEYLVKLLRETTLSNIDKIYLEVLPTLTSGT